MPLQTLRNPRLDALQYDQDIEELLFQRVRTVFSGLPTPVASFLECSHHELRLLVRTLIWGVHLSKGLSLGQSVQGIFYKRYERWHLITHYLISVFFPYLFNRLFCNSWLIKRTVMTRLQAVIRFVKLLHHLIFLRFGRYCTIAERLLKLQTFANGNTRNWEVLNKELLWHVFHEMMLLMMPIYAVLSKPLQQKAIISTTTDDNFLALHCSNCCNLAVLPVQNTSCEHLICYYCYNTNTECLICKKPYMRDQYIRLLNYNVI
ncbi:unnamed protein product [Enterobius vermicularis]|uniref:RING-type E3 ubiquitin transferase (cysteine targeting) n=1 Tax=Enterobius vermicularis TaxID=51028 RepID=A0A0N4V8V5_ENTVE|nr:unnamed protein product [Enterobius vermicularis]